MKKEKFDKYDYYQRSVQGPDVDIRFLRRLFRSLRNREALTLREDFCGTFLNLCEWVRTVREGRGIGVDLDPQPIDYGVKNNLAKLNEGQQQRVLIRQADVLKVKTPAADLITAFNFSYNTFHERATLLRYFTNCYRNLNSKGLLVLDSFGGSDCQGIIQDKTRKRGFWYYWDQRGYDPISNFAIFDIHFKRDGEKKRKRVFTYRWRLWTIPEIREIMLEAGFKSVLVYWQNDNGDFKLAKRGVGEASWLAHVVGVK